MKKRESVHNRRKKERDNKETIRKLTKKKRKKNR